MPNAPRPLYNEPQDVRLAAADQWRGRWVTVYHAPLRNHTPEPNKIIGKLVCAAVMLHGTTSDVIIIARPGQPYPLVISLAQVVTIGELT